MRGLHVWPSKFGASVVFVVLLLAIFMLTGRNGSRPTLSENSNLEQFNHVHRQEPLRLLLSDNPSHQRQYGLNIRKTHQESFRKIDREKEKDNFSPEVLPLKVESAGLSSTEYVQTKRKDVNKKYYTKPVKKFNFNEKTFQKNSRDSETQNVENKESVLEDLLFRNASSSDPQLLEYIREYMLDLPSEEPYNMSDPNKDNLSMGQAPVIDKELQGKENGFFIECGATDGQWGSNSYFFEKVRKWNGLLVEANPSLYKKLLSRHRKAYSVQACLNRNDYIQKVTFNMAFNKGRILHDEKAIEWSKQENGELHKVDVICLPIYAILNAIGVKEVDYFSLDIEGEELNVLKTIPFDKVHIKYFSVEYAHGGDNGKELQDFMESKGYETIKRLFRNDKRANDLIFRKIETNFT